MRTIFAAVIISLLAVNAIAQPPRPGSEREVPERERERLGVRAGYTGTTSGLDDTFGGGFNLALHWIQYVRYPLFADFTLGAFYMGKTGRQDITFDIFQQNFDNTSMRIIRLTAAPMIEMPVNERTTAYASFGGGLYVVSVLLDEAFLEFDATDNHLGISIAAGVDHRFTQNWSFDFHAEFHKIWTSDHSDDLFYRYSEGDQDPLFYQIAAGVSLRLF